MLGRPERGVDLTGAVKTRGKEWQERVNLGSLEHWQAWGYLRRHGAYVPVASAVNIRYIVGSDFAGDGDCRSIPDADTDASGPSYRRPGGSSHTHQLKGTWLD